MARSGPRPDRRPVRCLAAALAIAALCASGPAFADAELQRVFEQVLKDPTNVPLNLRYARMAEKKGERRKALGAYERVLSVDPKNAVAKAGIRRIRRQLQPDTTTMTALFGAQYETNPGHLRGSGSQTDDIALLGRVQIKDERKLGNRRWRTEGDLFANWHGEFGELNYGTFTASTGPLFDLTDDIRVHTAAGASYAFLDGKSFFVEGLGRLTFERGPKSIFRSLVLGFYYDNVGGFFSDLDAYRLEVHPRFVFAKLGSDKALGEIRPFYRYYGTLGTGVAGTGFSGDPFPLAFHQIGARFDYYYQITKRVILNLNVTVEGRFYKVRVFLDPAKRRSDFFASPGARLIISRIFSRRHSVIIGYQFDYNDSNDQFQDYRNHIVSIRSLWRF